MNNEDAEQPVHFLRLFVRLQHNQVSSNEACIITDQPRFEFLVANYHDLIMLICIIICGHIHRLIVALLYGLATYTSCSSLRLGVFFNKTHW